MPVTKEAQKQGGYTQSSKLHYCPMCDQFGRGNRFYSFHVLKGQCEGRGVKNYYSKKFQRDLL